MTQRVHKTSVALLSGAILALSLIPLSSSAQSPVSPYTPGEWIKSWLLCGPFPLHVSPESAGDYKHLPGFETDFLKAHGGETKLRVKPDQIETYQGGAARWVRYSSPDSVISLDKAVSTADYVVAYGYCEIETPQERVCYLALGSNDGGRLWLNGEPVWDYPEGRGVKPDNDILPVLLKKGCNTLLIKMEERGNVWGFCMRFVDLDARNYAERTPLFRIIPRKDGQVRLRFMPSTSVGKQLFKNVALALYSEHDLRTQLWSAAWNRAREQAIGLNPERFGRYVLKLEGTLVDGHSWTSEYAFAGGKRTEQVLFENGQTDYVIVLGEAASESEQWAAKELQTWLREISSADFSIVSDNAAQRPDEIVVGFNAHARALLGEAARQPDANDESFTYRNIGPTLLILGGSARGALYGVMTFLERELGCRWYTPRVSVIPQKPRYAFTALNHSEAPGIRVRNDFYFEAFEPIWAARNKINGAMNYRKQPGGVECYWSVHTAYRFMPPEEFYGAHPEYYSLIDGQRISDHAQLCLTNPDVLRIVTERLRQTLREQPEYLIYSVSQNDWRNPCQCENCQKIARREESESGPLIWFVNQVAEAIEKEFPDKYVGTLAYQYTRKPCKTLRPRENVVIRLCSIECCFAHDFYHCPENASFISDLEGWSAIAPHLYIWDYVVNFSHYVMPYPNFRVLQPNIRTFRANKAIGIMEQAAYQSRGGEFSELRAYVISKLLWNPDCDVQQVIDDFMFGYYGRSGQYVRQYFDRLHQRLTPETHIHLGLTPDDPLFSDEFVREADAIFDRAEAVADNEAVRQRVEVARLPIMYLKCKRSPIEAKYDGTYARFTEITTREGITHYAEAGESHNQAFHARVQESE